MLAITTRTVALLLGAVAFSASAQKFEQVYNIPISSAEKSIGKNPTATLAVGPDGKLYGATTTGGSKGHGTAFRISVTGQAEWLGDFDKDNVGGNPAAPLMSLNGQIYGVALEGGSAVGNRYGTIYRLDPNNIGTSPQGGLTAIYAVSNAGPTPVYDAWDFCVAEPGYFHLLCHDNAGIYRVKQDGSEASILYKFGPLDGGVAQSIISGGDGFLYGTTSGGNSPNGGSTAGTIFRIRVDGQEFTTLHEFPYTTTGTVTFPEGRYPLTRLLAAPDGFLYGTTLEGGKDRGAGTIFRIDRNGQNFKIIKDLDNAARNLNGELLLAPDGYLYGLAMGDATYGQIYRLKPDGSSFKVVYNFQNSKTDGGRPVGGLTLGPDGNLYGVTYLNSATSGGSVFRLVTNFTAPPANRPPVAMDDYIADVSFAGGAKTIAVKANDYDPDGDALVLGITDAPEQGDLTLLPGGAIRYTPRATFTTSDSFSYKISDGRSGESEATVYLSSAAATPLVEAALYTGLVREENDGHPNDGLPRGLVRVTLAATGKFTGSLQTQGKKITLTGKMSEAGIATVAVSLPDKTKGVVYLALQPGDFRSIYTVFYGPQLSTGLAAKAVALNTTVKKQLLTALVAPDAAHPVGYGHATGNLTNTGVLTLTGKLGDGTKLSVASNVTRTPNGTYSIPVFTEAIAKGIWGGDLVENGPNLTGNTRWVRPPALKQGLPYQAGFSSAVEINVLPFLAPTSKEPIMNRPSGQVTLAGQILTNEVTGKFTLNVAKVTVTAPLKALALTRTTGAFTGSMLVEGKAVAFTGSIAQATGRGFGQFIRNGVAGTVELGPEDELVVSAPPAE